VLKRHTFDKRRMSAASTTSSSENPVNFTVDLFEKTKDFALHTGIPASKMSDEMIEKISKGGAEYHPSKKTWVIPHAKLCDVLDECFDYFTEESLVNISKLLDKANVDKEIKDKVREKSVNKAGGLPKRESRHRPVMPVMDEYDEPLIKSLRGPSPIRPASKRGVIPDLSYGPSRVERPFGSASSSSSSSFASGYYSEKNESMSKRELLLMLSDLRARVSKVEQYVAKNM
jgi:hypothetical protein